MVAATAPSSAKPGAKAIISAEGALEGWIGGGCAQEVVIEEALAAMAEGSARLIRLSPDVKPGRPGDSIKELAMKCESGGTLEIHIEPVLPRMKLLIFGDGPVARSLAGLAVVLEYEVSLLAPGAQAGDLPDSIAIYSQFDASPVPLGGLSAAVVATQGNGDEKALTAALAAQTGYLTMITSRAKATSLFAALEKRGLPAPSLEKIKVPAGLDIKAVTPGEIAVSVLAEIIQVSRTEDTMLQHHNGSHQDKALATEIDPVCGMTVKPDTAAGSAEHKGATFYFCSLGCLEAFEKEPERYALEGGA